MSAPVLHAQAAGAPDDWFEVRQVRAGLWMIAEPCHVVSWLYAGTARAALIDSGTGIVPIAPLVARLTALPVSVVNTHYHFDHVGGNDAYPDRLAGVRGAALLARPASRALLERYLGGLEAPLREVPERLAQDPDAFALTPETRMRPLPPGFAAADWRPGAVPPSATLAEGDALDLGGGRVLRVLETPGHSPDGICLFDARDGILFAGDTLNEGTLYVHYDESSLSDLLASTRKLMALGEAVRCICAGHVARAIAETSLIGEVARAAALVQDGAMVMREARDVFGYPVHEGRLGRVWITRPHPDAGPILLAD